VITIEAFGAQGGATNGGKGARMKGDFALLPGDKLGIAVGKKGGINSCGSTPGTGAGGGGGGSFVWNLADLTLPLVAAGGGGGGNQTWGSACADGMDGVVGANGTEGNGALLTLAGVNGNGGGSAPPNGASGGGGWIGKGQDSSYSNGTDGCSGGLPAFTFAGGKGSVAWGPGGEGGFGGGGGAVCACGGGGGYSGGSGGEASSCRAGGGGGGSFNAGMSPSNSPGVEVGDGKIIVSWK
jgi:hypothetical protein